MTHETETFIIVMHQHSWGRGATLAEAKTNSRKAGGRGDCYGVAICQPKGKDAPHVNGYGSVCGYWGEDFPGSAYIELGKV